MLLILMELVLWLYVHVAADDQIVPNSSLPNGTFVSINSSINFGPVIDVGFVHMRKAGGVYHYNCF